MTTRTDPLGVDEPAGPTLFHPDLAARHRGEVVRIEGDELAHVRSLRLRAGDAVYLTDGAGGRWRGRIEAIERRLVTVVVEHEVPGRPPYAMTLLAPVGHRDRALWLVEKSVEIGVERIAFVEFERSRSVVDAGRSAALKQCGGSRLPTIVGAAPIERALESLSPVGGSRWLADPGGQAIGHAAAGEWHRVTLAIGPEGGLEAAEKDLLAGAGFLPVSLGPRVLRFETAAVFGLAVAAAALECRGSASTRTKGDR